MLYLNFQDTKIRTALKKHIVGLQTEVEKRLIKRLPTASKPQFITTIIKPNIKSLLSSKPSDLDTLNQMIKNETEYRESIEDIKYIFRYEKWFDNKKDKYNAYDLATNLDVQSCVYCNRIYTKTVAKPSKITRPSFDHWFDKGENPLLALSFFNLIPSCSICNSGVKGSHPFKLQEYLHPYVDIDCGYHFSYYNKKLNSYEFKIKADDGNVKAEKTVEAFKLEQIYESHLSEIKDLVRLRNVYSQNYLMNLHKFLNKDKTNVSMDEIYRLAFGTFINEEDFEKRPLSKMKRDILTELGII